MKTGAALSLAVALLVASSGVAHAAEASSAERDRIANERAAAKARLAEQERTCREQFVVTSCLEAARREERATLTRLRRAEQVLDDAQRREAAARRRQSIQERTAAQATRAGGAAASEPQRRSEPRPAPEPHPMLPSRAEPAASTADGGARRAAEQRSEAEFSARARAAQKHRTEVEQRNAARAASGKAARPLPAASGASAP